MNNSMCVVAVDDSHSKLTQLLAKLEYATGAAVRPTLSFAPEELQIVSDLPMNVVVDRILKADAAIVDYNLKSEANVEYSGIQVINEVLRRHKHFPVFLLTSYKEDVFTKEIIDVCHVFDFDKYLNDNSYAESMNRVLYDQIQNHKREKDAWEDELKKLSSCTEPRSVAEDERMIELDTWIEQATSGGASALSQKTKRDLSASKLDALIEKVDEVIASCCGGRE